MGDISDKIIDKAYGAVTTPVEVLLLCAVFVLGALLYICSRRLLTLSVQAVTAIERNTAVLEAMKENWQRGGGRRG